jgi:unsaturated chondroitin disaccharide hydrolase
MWQQALDYGIDCVRQNLHALTSFPEFTQAGHWQCVDDGGWVGGHWVGLLWLAYVHTRDDALCQAARAWAARLVPRQFDETTHDLGFLFELSHVWGARFTGDTALRSPALNAAQNLARRFNGRGKFIQAWGALDAPPARRGRAIIDTMMNLGLLYWASAQTGDPRYSSIATEHARTALACQVRPDGSTAHVADFDPDSGVFLRQDTYQGQSASSCWSRGQAWSVYGFANCYDKTREAIFLDAARNLADYALRRLPSDYVPYWDYDSPRIPHDVRDSSAAAILAAGLLKLAAVEADATLAERWRTETEHILESLWHHYSSRGTREPSILLHGTRNKPRDFADHGLIYGDYYFVEALTGLTTPERLEM